MRWQNRDGSNNVEDRRGQSGFGGGGSPLRGKAGVVVFIIVMIAGYYGVDLTPLLDGGGASYSTSRQYTPSPQEEQMARFTSVALKLTEETWADIFEGSGKTYTPPKLVLYSGSTSTTCGYGQAAMGPFYCPADGTVYIDLSFYADMQQRLGGGGDFAQGYVIAHEVGHHIQHVLGIDRQVQQARQAGREANRASVMLELQADCFAGVWGNAMQRQGVLEAGDLEEALRTAEAIGDDRLQRQSGGRVVPDSFTHGTSQQRYTWFKRGFDSGDPKMCDTFSSLR